MKKQLLLTKVLLIAICLMGGVSSVWADTETPVWSENYESYTDISQISSAWVNNGGNYQATLNLCSNECGNSSKWLLTYSGNGSRQTTEYYYFASAYTGKAYQFDAKLNMNDGNNNASESRLYFMNGSKSSNNNDPSNYLFYIGVNSSGKAFVSNGTDTETSTIGGLNSGTNSIAATKWSKTYKSTGWFNASCVIDLEQGKAKITLSSGNTNETFTISLKSGTKQLSGLCVRGGAKLYGVVALDDLALYALTYPAFTLASDAVGPLVGDNETVNVTDITGTITVSSSDESVATASYADGVVTINGVANGVAYITVKSTSEGVELEKTITATVGSVATTTVTINYLSDSTPIATPVIFEDVTVGSILTTSDITYDDVIYGIGYRYVNPTPDQTIPYTIVEDGVININYTAQAAVTNVKKIVKVGGAIVSSTDVAQEGKYANDNISFSYPLYINHNGTLYTKAANSQTYSQSFTLTATDQECVLAYTATDIANVVYHSEGEKITGATATSAGNNMNGRSSNQQCGYTTSDLTLINLPAGTYKVTTVIYSNSSAGQTLHFQYGDTPYDEVVSGSSNWNTQTEEFTLLSASDFKWLTSGDSKNGLDFIYIQKTGETATVGANGYTTFASPYALDLTDANRPEGLKAYKATLEGTTLSFTALNQKVPAGTGLLLLGETKGGSYDITVVASGDAVDGNDLTGVTADTPMQSNTEGDYIFVMRKASSADSPLTFAPLSTTTEVTVPAGKAYITVPASAFATLSRDLSISFGDETTSIADVRSKMEDVRGDYYNLQGQRVKAPTKGLYIVNGKKVIMK